MLFELNVKLTDKHYLDYNIFCSTKTPFGKKQIGQVRILICMLFAILALVFFFQNGLTSDFFISVCSLAIVTVVLQLLLAPFNTWLTKLTISSMKKSGKQGYSPVANMEFYEENFVENTPNQKTTLKYARLERITIVNNKVVYLHVNSILGYIIPYECFDSPQQYQEFVEFIKTKCVNVNHYN